MYIEGRFGVFQFARLRRGRMLPGRANHSRWRGKTAREICTRPVAPDDDSRGKGYENAGRY